MPVICAAVLVTFAGVMHLVLLTTLTTVLLYVRRPVTATKQITAPFYCHSMLCMRMRIADIAGCLPVARFTCVRQWSHTQKFGRPV